MRKEMKADLKARLDAVRLNVSAPGAEDTSTRTLIAVLEIIIDSLPDDKQPKLKPKGRSGR